MAYISQDLKAKLAPKIKNVLKKYGVKGSLAVRNHSTLVLTVKSGSIDFIGNYKKVTGGKGFDFRDGYLDVNPYWYQDHFDGKAKDFLREVLSAMKEGNWDRSDIMTDYFDVGWYVDVNIGKWNKPYVLE